MSASVVLHPFPDENGFPVVIEHPSKSTSLSTWNDPSEAATVAVTETSDLPASLNGLAFTCETLGEEDWVRMMRVPTKLVEPEPKFPKTEKRRTSGLVIWEPDGRFWLVHPTNAFGGVEATFPKGRLEPELSLLVNAVKEGWEESGILAEPLCWLCDIDRTKTMTRYYLARRISGSPAAAGWESQAVSLVPPNRLLAFLNRPNDQRVLPSLATRTMDGHFARLLR